MDNLFEVELKIIPQTILPFELASDDIHLIHKCLNRFVSPNYFPLDHSVYDGFFYYLNLLYKSTCFVLSEKVKNPLDSKCSFHSFDEAYQGISKYVTDVLNEFQSQSHQKYVVNTNFASRSYCKRQYLRKKHSTYAGIQKVFKDSLESPKWKDITFLIPSELETWIILLKQNLPHLKQSAQIFVLKFISLLSRNVKCFELLHAHQVYSLLWSEFHAKERRIHCLLLQIINNILSHKTGRDWIIKAKTKDNIEHWCDWRKILQEELTSEDTNFHHQDVLLDLLFNVTIVTDMGPFVTKYTVTRDFFQTVLSFNLESKVQIDFILKLVQRLLALSNASDKIAPDDMHNIVRTFDTLIENPIDFLDYNMACKFYQIKTYVDRLAMSYDNENEKPRLSDNKDFLERIVGNLFMLHDTNELITYKYNLESSERFTKWLDFAEVCCVIYLSKTPNIPIITSECSNAPSSPHYDYIQACHKKFHNILNSILIPVVFVLKKWEFMHAPSFIDDYEEMFYSHVFASLTQCDDDIEISVAMKSFACFRRIFPLLSKHVMMYHGGLNVFLLIQKAAKDIYKDYNKFSQLTQQFPEFSIEVLQSLEYLTPFDTALTHINNVIGLLNLFAHKPNEERIVQVLLKILKVLLNKLLKSYLDYGSQTCLIAYELLENNEPLVKVLLRSEVWEIRDNMLEVLLEALRLSLNSNFRVSDFQRQSSHKMDSICSDFTTYISLAENDPELFVRLSAIDVIQGSLLFMEHFWELGLTEVKNNIRIMVVDAMIRICINECDGLSLVEKSINLLAQLFSPHSKTFSFDRDIVCTQLCDNNLQYEPQILDIMKYYAIKCDDPNIKFSAVNFFSNRLCDFFRLRRFEDEVVFTKEVLMNYLIDIKVILTVLLYDDHSPTVLNLARKLISELIGSEHKEGRNTEPMHDLLIIWNKRTMNINEIIHLQGNLVISHKDDSSKKFERATYCAKVSAATHSLGEIVNTSDLELLASMNKPKNRYFSINNNSSNYNLENTKKKLPEFIPQLTFFDESLYTNENVLIMFLSVMSRVNIRIIIKRRFGIDIHEKGKENNWYHKMKSLFNDVLMYDSEQELQDGIDCY